MNHLNPNFKVTPQGVLSWSAPARKNFIINFKKYSRHTSPWVKGPCHWCYLGPSAFSVWSLFAKTFPFSVDVFVKSWQVSYFIGTPLNELRCMDEETCFPDLNVTDYFQWVRSLIGKCTGLVQNIYLSKIYLYKKSVSIQTTCL